jgi:hypothetical protein
MRDLKDRAVAEAQDDPRVGRQQSSPFEGGDVREVVKVVDHVAGDFRQRDVVVLALDLVAGVEDVLNRVEQDVLKVGVVHGVAPECAGVRDCVGSKSSEARSSRASEGADLDVPVAGRALGTRRRRGLSSRLVRPFEGRLHRPHRDVVEVERVAVAGLKGPNPKNLAGDACKGGVAVVGGCVVGRSSWWSPWVRGAFTWRR